MRIHIAGEDFANVYSNIKERMVVNANIEDNNLNYLKDKITETGNAIILANSNVADNYPNIHYKDVLISGKTMCKLIAVKKAINVIRTIVVEGKNIHIALNKRDIKYVMNHKLGYTATLGYVAIKGKLPIEQSELKEYKDNTDYYYTMGKLLNDRARRRFSWMKSLYREYRHGLLNCLIQDLYKRDILTSDRVAYILNNLEIVRDKSSFYNINHYIHYLCEVVKVNDLDEKNLFMTLLTDGDGQEFVERYENTKYLTRRKKCQNQEQINTLNILEKTLLSKTGLSKHQMISSMELCQMA